ncbi:MAG: GNAT family N-acetyltransferase [Erysipelotrichaceae bacterium]|nr:GNAT family N-acetyltransferase [Erysipelotrichaceae bacterium]MBQ7890036.1 GNAT family N-acetyltransferase [Erysipelotrichaceae bacterium]
MNIQHLSTQYETKILTHQNIDEIYELCLGNPLYYDYCPPSITKDQILADMKALPPHKSFEDKFYIGFFQNQKLIAVLDLILRYPDSNTAFIGFFMMHSKQQRKGKGSALIEEICKELQHEFKSIRLGVIQDNPQASHFWKKNQFLPTGIIAHTDLYDITIMERQLTDSCHFH